jgi:hypothetical protein
MIFDLVHYGGFQYCDVLEMKPFERDYYHELIRKSKKDEIEFQMALHDKKRK